MWRRVGVTMLATASAGATLAVVPTAPVIGTEPSAASSRSVQLAGVHVRPRAHTRQVITVNHRHGQRATVRFWRLAHGKWRSGFSARDGRTGYGGLVPGRRREQGSGTTPLGSYRMTESFGLAPRPRGSELAFHRVRAGDYWVQDNRSRWYNTLRNKRQGGFRWRLEGRNGSERLRDYPGQYRWSVVIDFNRPDPVRHRGSGIFLHVNGDGATAGCVSAPRWFIKKSMRHLDPGKRPVIAIGR